MLNPYASIVLEQVGHSCSLLAEEFSNIQAIQASSESEKNKKCMQWQEILHQIDFALIFIDIQGIAALIKIQSQAIAAVAKGDLASSTKLFTSLSQAQRTISLFLKMRLEDVALFPTVLFPYYRSIHEILFQDEASAAHLISLPQEAQLPTALKSIGEVDVDGITLQEIGLSFESALLKFLKNESATSMQVAAEEMGLLFSRIAMLRKNKNVEHLNTVPHRERLYSQIFQLYAQIIAEGCDFNLHIARKIFSTLRKKIHQLNTDANLTLRGELLQEVLFELGQTNKKDNSIIELLSYFDIEPQLEMLGQSLNIWNDVKETTHSWDLFAESVIQAKNSMADHYSLIESTDKQKLDPNYFNAAIVNMMEPASRVEESIVHVLSAWRAVFDSSSLDEQQAMYFLSFLLLLEQIVIEKKQWKFSEKNKVRLKIILNDVQINISGEKKSVKLGKHTKYFEKKQAKEALLRSLQQSLFILESKLELVFADPTSEDEEKLINKILLEIIAILNFLDEKNLILECGHLRDVITEYLNKKTDSLTSEEIIVKQFLQFEKFINEFALKIKDEGKSCNQVLVGLNDCEFDDEGNKKNEKLDSDKNSEKAQALLDSSESTAQAPLIASPTLQKIYLKEAQHLITQLTTTLHSWLESPEENGLLLASHAAHSLAGSSATVGLLSVSALATALEHVLHSLNEDAYEEVKASGLLIESAAALTSQLQELMLGSAPEAAFELVEKLSSLRDQLRGDSMCAETALSANLNQDLNLLEQSFSTSDDFFNLLVTAAESAIDLVPKENVGLSLISTEPSELPDVEINSEDDSSSFKMPIALEEVSNEAIDTELVAIFIEEAADYFHQLDTLLRNWLDGPQSSDIPLAVLRILHTLKGGARMAGCRVLGQLFHEMETKVEQLTQFTHFDVEKIAHLLHDFDLAISALASIKTASQKNEDELITQAEYQGEIQLEHQQDIASVMPSSTPIATTVVPQESSLVRVRTDALDRLAGSAAELIVDGARLRSEIQLHKKSLHDLTDTLIRLRSQLRECELVAESSIASKMHSSQPLDFDPLEFDRFTRLQELTRMMAESMSDTASIERALSRHVEKTQAILFSHEKYARAIQADLKRVRVVRFSSLSERLHHLVRQVGRESQREVRLTITGAHTEIDRSLLEKIINPIEHLLRNAITHGIESSEDRLKSGKDKCGNILINLLQQGNEIVITVSDDGRGLDFDRIEERAKSMDLLSVDATTTEDELTEFIFTPGFSTSAELTAIAGRGIGMDAVRETVLAQRGVIQVKSQTGQGVTFTLFLPLTLATAAVVIIQHGDKQLALPANMVEQVLQLSWSDLKLARQSGELMWRNERLPLHQLAFLSDGALSSETDLTNTVNAVIILRGVHGQLALEVQAILGNGEVVVRNIGPQASSVQGIVGASVMPDGSIALIINPLLFLKTEQQMRLGQSVPISEIVQANKVMVVDDSLTVRRISQRLLERAGYTVLLARDGMHAIEILQTEQPSIILLDIEMPRMDGFEFLHYLRNDAQNSEVPVVMITSRTAEKHRKHAIELGATAYLGKPFNETELLTLLKSFA